MTEVEIRLEIRLDLKPMLKAIRLIARALVHFARTWAEFFERERRRHTLERWEFARNLRTLTGSWTHDDPRRISASSPCSNGTARRVS